MLKIVLQAAFLMLMVVPGLAQDWVVTRVRGTAEHQPNGRWVELTRGAVVLDNHSVRTGSDGRVSLARGQETIELDAGTSIVLQEGAGKMTSVKQASGIVTVDVERRNVQHFSVQTPFLAAVVKGTRFRVVVTETGANVDVDRGTVQVQDTANDLVVDVVRGQQAQVSRSEPLTVSGPGQIAVFTFDGVHIVNGTVDTPAGQDGQPVSPSDVTTTENNPRAMGRSDAAGEAGNNGNGNASGGGNGNNGNGNAGGGGNGNNGNGNAGGGGNGNNGNGNAGGGGSGNNGNGNAGGGGNGNNGNGNAGAGGNGNNGNGNAGGGGNGNNGNGNGNASGGGNGNNGNGNAGGGGNGNNGNGNAGAGGNGNNDNGNAGTGGNGNSGNGNAGAGGNGNNGNGNAGGNGNNANGDAGGNGNNGNGNASGGENGNGNAKK